MSKAVIGILAHVDAGKTTLSEALLFATGTIRSLGRVDNRDAFLDTFEMERQRGITIFSKQARLHCGDLEITLVDTPGHVDFSPEAERTLQVLDYAILVVSGADGVQGHTRTLWKLCQRYEIPTFLFVNKMDQPGTDAAKVLQQIHRELSPSCVDVTGAVNSLYEGGDKPLSDTFLEEVAVCREELMETYLEEGNFDLGVIPELICNRELFPCFFGSALKLEGIHTLLAGMEHWFLDREYPQEFGARIYKIGRDASGNRLTYLKVTGGELKNRDQITYEGRQETLTEKIHQIRRYHAERYETTDCVSAGELCAVTGLSETTAGQGLGYEAQGELPVLEPVLTYRIDILDDGVSVPELLPKLRLLEEEEPQLHLVWKEEIGELQAQVMGEVQMEVLKQLVYDRFGVAITFGQGNIVYKETISNVVEGIGHFEPLRHYAEVHLLLEPGEPGSGIEVILDCREDILDKNWQRLIATHVMERKHRGVLTGGELTDVRVRVIAGKAHPKHTEGGDFRQATYRAVRQGLMQAQSILLEPFYRFTLEIPSDQVGRAMTDLDQMGAAFEGPEISGEHAVITGRGPVSELTDYPREVVAYTKGQGRLSCVYGGYYPCHNAGEVMEHIHYDPELDLRNPSASVFCAHGAGFAVPWDQVREYMHVESGWKLQDGEAVYKADTVRTDGYDPSMGYRPQTKMKEETFVGTEEIDAILRRATHANQKDGFIPHKGIGYRRSAKRSAGSGTSGAVTREYKRPVPDRDKYLLVDGYNVIFAWKSLSELAADNMDGARGALLDTMCNYQGYYGCEVIVVFDAYRVKGHATEYLDYHNIHVVYTKEAETADQYIEKFSHENGRKYDITVATSDGLEQIIIRGQGCRLVSSRELEQQIRRMQEEIRARLEF